MMPGPLLVVLSLARHIRIMRSPAAVIRRPLLRPCSRQLRTRRGRPALPIRPASPMRRATRPFAVPLASPIASSSASTHASAKVCCSASGSWSMSSGSPLFGQGAHHPARSGASERRENSTPPWAPPHLAQFSTSIVTVLLVPPVFVVAAEVARWIGPGVGTDVRGGPSGGSSGSPERPKDILRKKDCRGRCEKKTRFVTKTLRAARIVVFEGARGGAKSGAIRRRRRWRSD